MEKSTEVAPARFSEMLAVGLLTRVFPRDLVDEVLGATRKLEKRSRLLPARVVVYFVLCLSLFSDANYVEVIRRMLGGLRFLSCWDNRWHVPTSSALTQARKRLGEAPLEELFQRAAVPIATPGTPGAWFGPWRVMAMDGLVLDAPDSEENEAEFGRLHTGNGASAFPQVRVVALAECGTHAIVGARIRPIATSENPMAQDLAVAVEPGMLVIVDRGLHSLRLWESILERGGACLFRVSSQVRLPALKILPDGSYISVLLPNVKQSPIRKAATRKGRGDPDIAAAFLLDKGTACRVIDYQVGTGSQETIRLITSLLDPDEGSAPTLAALYHERWEIEMIFDEIEVHQLGGGRVFRSKSPELVRQEIWGAFLTHYAIRHFMHEAADTVGVDEDRLSFLHALRIVRHQLTSQVDFSPYGTHDSSAPSS